MDHLPLSTKATRGALIIPFICDELEPYDGLGFFRFPERQGWRSSTNLQWSDCGPDHAAARAQCWLYFGSLRELLGSGFNLQRFVCQMVSSDSLPSQTKCRVTTEELPSLSLSKSIYRVSNQKAQSITQAIEEAQKQSFILEQCRTYSTARIALSIGALVLTLKTAWNKHFLQRVPLQKSLSKLQLPNLVLHQENRNLRRHHPSSD